MSQPASNCKCLYHFVIPHPAKPRILMFQDVNGWMLPRIRTSKPRFVSEVSGLAGAIRNLFGFEATVLRYIHWNVDRNRNQIDAIYVLENHSLGWQPPLEGNWVGLDGLANLQLAFPAHLSALTDFLMGTESGQIPGHRSLWARQGWFQSAATWMQTQLEALDYAITAPVEHSCILRVQSTHGTVYFKQAADLPCFTNEPATMNLPSEIHPGNIPRPLAIDKERRWMLLPDLGPPVGQKVDGVTVERVLGEFARIQIDSTNRVDELVDVGCLDRGLKVLETQIDPVLNDESTLSGLNSGETERLHSIAPRLREACHKLADYNIPNALVHGDLHWGNIAAHQGKLLIFDWADACISHPFIDTVTMHTHASPPQKMPESHARQLDAYLCEWIDYEPMDRLREAWCLARALGTLHQVVSCRHIAANLEPLARDEIRGAAAAWSRSLLEPYGNSNLGE